MNNELQIVTNQTPIEIELGIDEKGMTTARKLYEFLEMDKSNYSRWIRNNITENEFAEKDIDFLRFVFDDETPTGGKIQREDYKLTAKFAKKLSMLQKNEKGEQAREYFARVEETTKEIVSSMNELSPQLQLLINMELKQKEQDKKIEELQCKTEKQKEAIQAVSETLTRAGTEEEYQQWVTKAINRIANSSNFYYLGNKHQGARVESYKRLTDKAHCRLGVLVENAVKRLEDRGATKAQIKAVNKLTVIMQDRKLKELYSVVIREMLVAYCVEVA